MEKVLTFPVSTLFRDVRFFIPEIIVVFTILSVLIIELFLKEDEKRNLWLVSFLGLIGAFVVLIFVYPIKLRLFFHNLYQDYFANFWRAFSCFTGILAVLLSSISTEIDRRSGEYFAVLLALVLGMMLLSASGNLLMIYLSFEMMSLSSYLLTGMHRNSLRSREAALKYLLFGAVSSGIMLYGFSLLYGVTGQIDITAIRFASKEKEFYRTLGIIAFFLISAGVFFKIAAFPFHFWSPDAYEGAPTPVAGFLSVGPKAIGFAFLIRFFLISFSDYIMKDERWIPALWNQIPDYIALVSALTMTVGNLSALLQKSVKRLLAYSSIAHAGYILVGIASMNKLGIYSTVLYLIVYAFMNFGAFASISFLISRGMEDNLESFKGLGWNSPLFGACTSIFLLSLVGIPPLGGFVAKLLIFGSAVKEGMYVLVIVAVLNSVVSLYYYALILKKMYLEKSEGSLELHLSYMEGFILLICAVPVVGLGLLWGELHSFLEMIIKLFNL